MLNGNFERICFTSSVMRQLQSISIYKLSFIYALEQRREITLSRGHFEKVVLSGGPHLPMETEIGSNTC